jgi:hypothetical protein
LTYPSTANLRNWLYCNNDSAIIFVFPQEVNRKILSAKNIFVTAIPTLTNCAGRRPLQALQALQARVKRQGAFAPLPEKALNAVWVQAAARACNVMQGGRQPAVPDRA